MDDPWDLFFGQSTQTQAHVYAEYAGDCPDGSELTGTITGPYCQHSRTLPATVVLESLGCGIPLLARAVLPDPCFWSPGMPFLYEMNLEVRQRGNCIQRVERQFGMHPIGVKRNSLYCGGKRWVVRGSAQANPQVDDLPTYREQELALFCEQPPETLCEQASRLGVVVVAGLGSGDRFAGRASEQETADTSDSGHLRSELKRLSKWPAVPMVVSAEGAYHRLSEERPRNMLLGCRVAKSIEDREMPKADFLLLEGGNAAELAEQVSGLAKQRPVLMRVTSEVQSATSLSRDKCDQLQRDLAAYGDFAGYFA